MSLMAFVEWLFFIQYNILFFDGFLFGIDPGNISQHMFNYI